ncbi:tetratricopeptide repeat protein [Tautonia rosea]|uniref:tetratricopeptide repeat protein n=1 Tax=Tautonia rosea TaxID=2728037 RepID=UPI0014762AD0|nr:tetratricopeptide repeat protein [Tautonia rosea]
MNALGSKRLLVILVGLIAFGGLVVVLVPSDTAPSDEDITVTRSSEGHWESVRQARRMLDSGRPDLAFDAVKDIRDQEPGAAEAMTIAGVALFRLGDPVGARRALEVALNLQPNQPEAARALAALCLDMGDTTRGLSALDMAADAAPNDARPWADKGRVHLDLGEFDEAVHAFNEALKRNPEREDVRQGLIVSLLKSNRAEEATARVKEALIRKPDDPMMLGLAAQHAFASGDLDRARQMADQALELDPDADEALLARGRTHHASDDLQEALADLERFLELRPNNLSALQLLGQIEARLGLTERAAQTADRHRAAYERADRMTRLTEQIAEQPDDPAPRWQMGQIALEGGSTELARRCFQAALMLDPGYQPARDSLTALDQGGPTTDPNGVPTASPNL